MVNLRLHAGDISAHKVDDLPLNIDRSKFRMPLHNFDSQLCTQLPKDSASKYRFVYRIHCGQYRPMPAQIDRQHFRSWSLDLLRAESQGLL